MNGIQTFDFNEDPVRVVMHGGAPWFVAADVCRVLEIGNPSEAVRGLDEDEKITLSNPEGNPRAGIPHQFNCVSESGLYALVFKSRKPEAKRFRKWVTSEVLPMIRESGSYVAPVTHAMAETVSIFDFVRQVCLGWSLEQQMEFGLAARRFAKAMGVVFQVGEQPGLGRVFLFPRQVLQTVHASFSRATLLPDHDAVEMERLILALLQGRENGTRLIPEMVRGVAKTMGLFQRIFSQRGTQASECSAFGRIVERFSGSPFPSGVMLSVIGIANKRRYEIRRVGAELALQA